MRANEWRLVVGGDKSLTVKSGDEQEENMVWLEFELHNSRRPKSLEATMRTKDIPIGKDAN